MSGGLRENTITLREGFGSLPTSKVTESSEKATNTGRVNNLELPSQTAKKLDEIKTD